MIAFEQEEITKLRQQVAVIEQHYQQAMAKQSATNKDLVAQIEELKKVQRKQRDDHDILWKYTKALEQRLIRAERHESAKSGSTT